MKIKTTALLKSLEWEGLAVGKNLLISPLPIESAVSAGAPVIAYGIEQAESVGFLPASESNKQKLPEIQRRELAGLLVSRIKVMAKLDIAEKRVPQDGRISLRVGGARWTCGCRPCRPPMGSG